MIPSFLSATDFNEFLILLVLFLVILSLLECYYYENIKYYMKKGYNYRLYDDKIEILLKKEDNVEISFQDIKKCDIKFYSYIFKIIFNLCLSDTNFKKDISIIKLSLDDNENLYKRKGIYYNLFNYKKSKKKGTTIFLYEIMYDEKSYENLGYIGDLLIF